VNTLIEPCYRQLGAQVEKFRTMLGWTQEELAKKLGFSRGSIANIELGRQRVMLHDVERLAASFQTTPKQLMRGIWT
jgi:transcriptional regulator with XRE-family HTH domain